MSALIDTCLVVDDLRGWTAATRFLDTLAKRPCLSSISLAELHAGVRSQAEERRLDAKVKAFSVLPLSAPVARRAGQFFRHFAASHGTTLEDAVIGATAEHYGLDLATRNVRHFPMWPRLRPAY